MTTDKTAALRSPLTPLLVEPSAWCHVDLEVNGHGVSADVESRLLLSDFLRERLTLTGTHVGCEQGACGACTVLVDGRAVRSCLTLAAACSGREIRTVEGLAEGALHPVQQAFHDHHGLQCGFCTSGFLMSITELHEREEAVDEDELMDQLSGNICRCTGYRGIERAARQSVRVAQEGDGHE
ncbi:(2Fe-2S)-binding protein [Janibacter terrae]|uniref:(2Fe-2S)-binding protein n=1 Tax=Janibacter terrae TaxID=103817 RepID=UPI0031F8E689